MCICFISSLLSNSAGARGLGENKEFDNSGEKMTSQCYYQAGVIGDPIGHSLSPDVFKMISHWTRIPMDYKAIRVEPRELLEFVSVRKKLSDWVGWNVTLPHKIKMTEFIDVPSKEIQTIQALNVVKNSYGKLYGFNTDVFGIKETLREHQIEVEDQNALIIGAGGAASAVAFVLAEKRAKSVWIFSRTSKKAKLMADKFNLKFAKTKFQFIPHLSELSFLQDRPTLFFQTTPVGMMGFPNRSLLPHCASKNDFAFDVIYRPILTPFLKDALARGMKTAGGMDMFIWQALATWEIWMEQSIKNRNDIKNKISLHLKP